jgi:hypothetical protein
MMKKGMMPPGQMPFGMPGMPPPMMPYGMPPGYPPFHPGMMFPGQFPPGQFPPGHPVHKPGMGRDHDKKDKKRSSNKRLRYIFLKFNL